MTWSYWHDDESYSMSEEWLIEQLHEIRDRAKAYREQLEFERAVWATLKHDTLVPEIYGFLVREG